MAPEQFTQQTFVQMTKRFAQEPVEWRDSPEIRLERVQSDGLLVIHKPQLLAQYPPPWSHAQAYDEVMLELKLVGNHLDREQVERALLRCQARQVQRVVEQGTEWLGDEPLWLVAPHVPGWLSKMRSPQRVDPGCYWIKPHCHHFLWIAANELPLRDELIPFLLARSGQAMDEFARWAAARQPSEWTITMLSSLSMSTTTQNDVLALLNNVEDPEVEARVQRVINGLLDGRPQMKEQLVQAGREQGRIEATRVALRRVLASRQLVPSMQDDLRIEACSDVATLDRWLGRAGTATSVTEVLE